MSCQRNARAQGLHFAANLMASLGLPQDGQYECNLYILSSIRSNAQEHPPPPPHPIKNLAYIPSSGSESTGIGAPLTSFTLARCTYSARGQRRLHPDHGSIMPHSRTLHTSAPAGCMLCQDMVIPHCRTLHTHTSTAAVADGDSLEGCWLSAGFSAWPCFFAFWPPSAVDPFFSRAGESCTSSISLARASTSSFRESSFLLALPFFLPFFFALPAFSSIAVDPPSCSYVCESPVV
jgi:hypothetical protein